VDEKPETIDLSQYRLVQAPPSRLPRAVRARAPSCFADRLAGADADREILAWIRSHVSGRSGGQLH
jgi:hypothetical protein